MTGDPAADGAGGPSGDTLRAHAGRLSVLGTAQVLGGLGVTSGITVNGLVARDLSGSTAWAGFAQTMGVLGAALLAVPLARLAGRRGRRPALATGYFVAAVGAALSLLAAVVHSFPLLLLGAGLFGGGSASGLQSRFAAIDGVGPAIRGRALSLVVWAATVGSVAGPNLAAFGDDLDRVLGVPRDSGTFAFGLAGFLLAGVLLVLFLPSGVPAGGAAASAAPGGALRGVATGLRHVAASPGAVLGLSALAIAHAVMVAVMVMTPLHLRDGGATLRIVGLVISVHVAGMYALSPVMGWVADRFGRRAGIWLGGGLLAAACLTAASAPPDAHGRLGVALTLLGLGWSGCLVAGSTLLSESVPAEVRTSVQGLSDLVMGLVAAVAGALSGPVVAALGYAALAAGSVVLLLPVLVLLLRSVGRVEPVGAAG